MVFSVCWVGCMIAARLYLEDVLCIGKVGFSLPIELAHMALWWTSVTVSYVLVVRAFASVSTASVWRWVALMSPGILVPPVLDFLLFGRTFDYPYPAGGFWDYVSWTLGGMPHSVTTGQRLEIAALFLLTVVWVSRSANVRSRLATGLGCAGSFYLIMTGYAWYPSLFRGFWDWAIASPEVFATTILSLTCAAQVSWLVWVEWRR